MIGTLTVNSTKNMVLTNLVHRIIDIGQRAAKGELVNDFRAINS